MWIGIVVGAFILLLVIYFVYIIITDNRAVARTRKSRATPMEIMKLTKENDVPGLVQAFGRPFNDWDSRELIVAALGNICRDAREGTDYQRSEMVAGLQSIITQCKKYAETNGSNTFTESCTEHAEMLLRTRFS